MRIKQLFCKHKMIKIGFRQAETDYIDYDGVVQTLRYSIRIYKCEKCGKQKEVDGRYDPYEN